MNKKFRIILTVCILLTVIPPILVYERGYYTFWSWGNLERIEARKANKLLSLEDIVILDVREPGEFNIGHINNAQLYRPEILDSIDKNTPILLYCTASVRSNYLAKELNAQGFQKIYELKGGLLHWKNRGYDLVGHNRKTTDSLHTYNEWLSHFLRKGVAVY